MFYEPLCPMPAFQTIEQLLAYSKHVEISGIKLPKRRYYKMDNHNILFTVNPKFTYLSLPWLGIEDFLKNNGFKEVFKSPFQEPQDLNGYERDFDLLRKQMLLQYWAVAFQKCNEKAQNIQPVVIQQEVVFHDITFCDYSFREKTEHSFAVASSINCKGMVQAYPRCDGANNAGTFIYCGTFLLVCDEYGRTFLLQRVCEEKPLIPIVSQLIKAGYTINPTPSKYVTFDEN